VYIYIYLNNGILVEKIIHFGVFKIELIQDPSTESFNVPALHKGLNYIIDYSDK
jgi:hypothetical protein